MEVSDCGLLGAVESSLLDDLALAETMPTTVALTDLSEAKQGRSRVVYYVLSHLLAKAPLQLLMSCPDNKGYEAWRLFKCDYEPSSGSKHVAMLSGLMRPSFGTTHQEICENLRKGTNDVKTYEASSGDLLSDSMRISIVIQAAPPDIREKLQLHDFGPFGAFKAKIEQYIHTLCIWSSEPAPMDIGALWAKGGSKQKGGKSSSSKNFEAKGKDGKKSGKGLKKPFEGYCSKCGKRGHNKSECWSNLDGGKA